MAKKFELAVKTGSYEIGRDKKNRYQNCGEVHSGEHGFFARINPYVMLGLCHMAIAEGQDSMLVSMFEPKNANSNGAGSGNDQFPEPPEFPDPEF